MRAGVRIASILAILVLMSQPTVGSVSLMPQSPTSATVTVQPDTPQGAITVDTDADGLSDKRERRINTNVTAPDTDGDGLPDGAEVGGKGALSDADPLHYDVFLEVSYDEGTKLTDAEQRKLKQAFEEAPIENPDGSTGVSLHLLVDEEPSDIPDTVYSNQYWEDFDDDLHETQGDGSYHVTLVHDIGSREDTVGLHQQGHDSTLIEDNADDNTGSIVMHELGHMLGIQPRAGIGVDSFDRSYDTYPSVMNYNSPSDAYRFSDGSHGAGDINDWGIIANNQNPPELDERHTTRTVG